MTCREAEQMVMPYIKGELELSELKEFLQHVDGCESCSEELEIYYTIHRALEQLDNEHEEQYDIHSLLEENMRQARQYVYTAEGLHFCRMVTGLAASAALMFAVVVQLYLWI